MRIACIYSSRCIACNVEQYLQKKVVFPWCIETFVMLAMESKEYAEGNFIGKNERKFLEMCDIIWNATSFLLEQSVEGFTTADLIMVATAATQLSMQESPEIKQYRYWRIFNDNREPLNLKKVFREKMGTKYEDFLSVGKILQLLFYTQESTGCIIPPKAFEYLLYKKFPLAATQLLTTRDDYTKFQHKHAHSGQDPLAYIYSLRPSVQFPLVEYEGEIHIPLPHLIMDSVTSALLYRITENDGKLRTSIGKTVWEEYLYEIVLGAGVYDEIYQEQEYRHMGSIAYSPDVLVREGKNVLLLESKSSVPSVGLRIFDAASYEKNIDTIAKYLVQLFKQMQNFDQYNPFNGEVSTNTEDFWGLVVLLEDSYIMRKHYYEKARQILEMSQESPQWNWLISHIKIVGLYEVERLSLCGVSMIQACKEMFKDDPCAYPFIGYPQDKAKYKNKSFLDFREAFQKEQYALLEEMESAGCFSEDK